jgi:hypothetical protein
LIRLASSAKSMLTVPSGTTSCQRPGEPIGIYQLDIGGRRINPARREFICNIEMGSRSRPETTGQGYRYGGGNCPSTPGLWSWCRRKHRCGTLSAAIWGKSSDLKAGITFARFLLRPHRTIRSSLTGLLLVYSCITFLHSRWPWKSSPDMYFKIS